MAGYPFGGRAAGRALAALALSAGVTAALAGPTATSAGADAAVGHVHVHGAHGASHGGGGTTTNLVDHGGTVLSASHLYTIWWGPSSAWPSDVQGGMATFFAGLNGSTYLKTALQYLRGAPLSATAGSVATDSSTPPAKVSTSTLGAEVAKLFPTVDPSGIYVVFTSNFPKGGGFCAWHGNTSVNGTAVSVAYMPNSTGVTGCDPGNLFGVAGSEGLRSLADSTAHEVMESITDPQINAWYDKSGSEIGDKCVWQYAAPVTLHNNSVWQLQEEWSNAVSGCVQTTS